MDAFIRLRTQTKCAELQYRFLSCNRDSNEEKQSDEKCRVWIDEWQRHRCGVEQAYALILVPEKTSIPVLTRSQTT